MASHKIAAVDFGNLRTRVWFTRRLGSLLDEYGTDGFTLDEGEPSFQPGDAEIPDVLECTFDYTRAWVRHVAPTARASEAPESAAAGVCPSCFVRFDRLSLWTL